MQHHPFEDLFELCYLLYVCPHHTFILGLSITDFNLIILTYLFALLIFVVILAKQFPFSLCLWRVLEIPVHIHQVRIS